MCWSLLSWLQMTLYKFRAETIVDANTYYSLYPCPFYVISPIRPNIPDCEVIMMSPQSLEEIRDQMDEIPDGHVMSESLNIFAEYDGERH